MHILSETITTIKVINISVTSESFLVFLWIFVVFCLLVCFQGLMEEVLRVVLWEIGRAHV